MKRTCQVAAIAGAAFAVLFSAPSKVRAQTADTHGGETSPNDALRMGEWSLRPLLELRTRAEARRNPFDTGGFVRASDTQTVIGGRIWTPAVENQWFVHERARIGLAAERGALRAVVQMQDARAWGDTPPMQVDGRDVSPATSVKLAYAEVREQTPKGSFLRVGRQEIQWGEGRLLGRSDWSLTGRSLDAARGVYVIGSFDLEGFSSILSMPGALPPAVSRSGEMAPTATEPEGPGAQLHGARVAWHVAPLLAIELQSLARFVRQPAPSQLTPSDLYVAGLRASGRSQRFEYSAEGAYQFGRVASVGENVSIRAFAGAARAELTTGPFWKMRIGVQGAYASGQKPGEQSITRFDPILPDVHTTHGPMGLYAWSNVIEGAGWLRFVPFRESQLLLGYRYVALARPSDTWTSASLVRIGTLEDNTSRHLGHEIDAGFRWSPWGPLALGAGYGAFVTGEGAKAILHAQGRGSPELQHFGYVQATMVMK